MQQIKTGLWHKAGGKMVIDSKNNLIILTVEEGMIFRSKIDGTILTKQLFLGCNDKYENYDEVSEEEVYAETEGDTVQEEREDGVQ